MLDWLAGRVKQFFSTEFVLAVIVIYVFMQIVMAGKMDATVAGAFGAVVLAVGNYAWQRTKQKDNGK